MSGYPVLSQHSGCCTFFDVHSPTVTSHHTTKLLGAQISDHRYQRGGSLGFLARTDRIPFAWKEPLLPVSSRLEYTVAMLSVSLDAERPRDVLRRHGHMGLSRVIAIIARDTLAGACCVIVCDDTLETIETMPHADGGDDDADVFN